ncbi:MAG: caspase family protein [Planctomycetota bacterium]
MRRKNTVLGLAGLTLLTAWPAWLLHAQQETSEERGARALVQDVGPTLDRNYSGRHALVIGIDKYEDPGFPDLSYATRDAKGVAEILVRKYGFATENVHLLLDGAATSDALIHELKDWASDPVRIGENDLFVFFFAGHGETQAWGRHKKGYLVPVDGRTKGGERIWSSLVDMDDIQGASLFIPAKHAVFILDC